MGSEPRASGVCCVGRRQRAARDSPPHPAAVRGQECSLRLCALQASPWQGLRCVSPSDRCQRHSERGKPDQASDSHHPAGHREAPSLGSQLYLNFLLTLEIYFLPRKKKKKKKKKKKS